MDDLQPKIRNFKSGDRERIRNIATSTASGCYLSDRRLVADLLTDYYVKYEPEHLLVAEAGNEVAGYLLGCFDTSRCRRIKAGRVIPRAVTRSLLRGVIGVKEIKYLWLFTWLTVRGELNDSPPPGYPAHFHINLREGARGMRIGSALAGRFLAMLCDAGVKGVHVRVRRNDRRASNFFRNLGFSRKCGYATLLAGESGIRVSRTVIYTKKLS